MFVENFIKFTHYYAKGRKIKMFGFFLLSLIAGALEFVGIAFVYPFIMLIINPESITGTSYYKQFEQALGIEDTLAAALIIGMAVVVLFILKNLFMILILYLQNKFVSNWKKDIGNRFMRYYIFSPYKNSLDTTPSEKIYNIIYLIGQVLDGFIFRLISLVSNIVIVSMILVLLLIKFPFAALVTSGVVILTLGFQNKYFKNKIAKIGQKFYKDSFQLNEKTLESLNNIKEIKINSAEEYFYKNFSILQNECNKTLIGFNFYSSIPPYIIEIFIVIALFILTILVSFQNIDETSWMIASYAIIVAAVFRIAPALNRIQTCTNIINSSRDFLKTLLAEHEKYSFTQEESQGEEKLKFQKEISLKNVYFTYKNKPVIKGLSLDIKKGEFIGIVGASGAGKSTLADILMGLLPIQKGEIYIDGLELNQKNFFKLRKLVGYVPQQINVLDGNFRENVAFGIESKNIDDKRVFEVLKQVCLWDLV